jgi:hypothetical protein
MYAENVCTHEDVVESAQVVWCFTLRIGQQIDKLFCPTIRWVAADEWEYSMRFNSAHTAEDTVNAGPAFLVRVHQCYIDN